MTDDDRAYEADQYVADRKEPSADERRWAIIERLCGAPEYGVDYHDELSNEIKHHANNVFLDGKKRQRRDALAESRPLIECGTAAAVGATKPHEAATSVAYITDQLKAWGAK